MAKIRCKETTMDSFFGNFLYQQKVAKDHFLRKLDGVIDRSRFTNKLLKYYKGKGEMGRAPYNPTIILKMLLLSFLYNSIQHLGKTGRDVGYDSLSIGLFLGLGADEKAPDHSTLTLFKNRLIGNCSIRAYEELFNEMITMAVEKGIEFGKLQVVDSIHILADVNLTKDEKRKREGRSPRDSDARWGAKGDKLVIGKDGKKQRGTEYFYGYKDQVSLNAETELVTSVIPGRANDYDGHKLKNLIEKDLNKGIQIETVAGDKGYDDGDNPRFRNLCESLYYGRYYDPTDCTF